MKYLIKKLKEWHVLHTWGPWQTLYVATASYPWTRPGHFSHKEAKQTRWCAVCKKMEAREIHSMTHGLQPVQAVLVYEKIRKAYDAKLDTLHTAREEHIKALIAETHTDSVRLRQKRIQAIDEEIRYHQEMRDLVLFEVGRLGVTE